MPVARYETPPPGKLLALERQPSACWLPAAAIAPKKSSPLRSRETTPAVAKSDGQILAVGPEVQWLRIELGGAVTNDGILGLAASSYVRHLELVWGGESCAVDVETIASLASCALESLHLECFVDGDLTGAVIEISSRTSTLRRLDVHECNLDPEEVMAALAECPTLRELHWHAFATDVAVWELVSGGSKLELLSLSAHGDTAVSDDALLAVGSYCPALRRLCLRGCADVTPRSLRELRAQLPALTVVGPDEDEAEGARMPASGGGLKRRGGEAPHGYDGPGGDSDDELETRPLESAKRAKAAAWPLTPAAAR